MRKHYFIVALLSLSILSCKKEKKDNTPSPLEVVVSGLSTKTSITIRIDNQNQKRVLEVINKFGNTTYKSEAVNSGDVLKVSYNSNIASDLEDNGNGSLTFYYKGQFRAIAGGNLSYPKGNSISITLP